MAADQIPTGGAEVLLHGGWVTTAAIGALAWLARVTIGRNLKSLDDKLDKQAEDTGRLTEMVTKMDSRLARLEGRFEQQDHSR